MIIDHNHIAYKLKWASSGVNRFNGAYYYSVEIVDRIIPAVRTTRDWVTVNIQGYCSDGAIVFIHNNKHPEYYNHLRSYDDLILVCGVPETCEKVAHLGTPIYLPLSIDVPYVQQFLTEKDRDTAYVGRPSKTKGCTLPAGISYLEGLPRDELLEKMARYRKVYAVGRCALEAKALGCEVLPYDPRFPDPEIWQVLDNLDAARILQQKLEEIDGREGDHIPVQP